MRKFLLSARSVVPGLLLLMGSLAAPAQAILVAQKPAPGFTLTAQDGSSISLSSLRGQWVVVFFYPSTTDAGSITEVKAFQSDLSKYAKWGSVLGISTSSVALQKQLALSAGSTVPLLSDPKGTTAKAYGSFTATSGTASRNTFLIDPQGNIARSWTGVSPASISSQVMSNLSLKPPVPTAKPVTTSLKPPVP
jgi:thioredoxin-dependent peroxiredoxin